jgi:hypothetical protein
LLLWGASLLLLLLREANQMSLNRTNETEARVLGPLCTYCKNRQVRTGPVLGRAGLFMKSITLGSTTSFPEDFRLTNTWQKCRLTCGKLNDKKSPEFRCISIHSSLPVCQCISLCCWRTYSTTCPRLISASWFIHTHTHTHTHTRTHTLC